MSNYNKIEPILPEDSELKIREELVGIHSINPFVRHITSSRGVMLASHLTQTITLKNGDERIIQTGVEKQLGDNTFSRKIENDSRLITILSRYDGIDANSVNATTELLLVYEDLVTGEIDALTVPNHYGLHQYFGFEYKWNDEVLSNITTNSILPKDTIIADSPTVGKNKSYKFGVNANVALLSIPEVAEDGIVISDEFAEKMTYDIFETRVVEYGSDSFPLNIYGDDENYKPFPEIGEKINDDSVVMVLRDYNSELSPALTSRKDVREFDPMFDKAIYVKKPGGTIVDIKVIKNPKFKKEVYEGTSDLADKYADGLINYHKKIIDIYETLNKDHYAKYRNNNLNVSERFNKLILDSYAIVNPDDKKIRKTYKNNEINLYRIEFKIKHTIKRITLAAKASDLHGAKGVVVEVRKKEEMPYDELTGTYADIIMDPSSIPSRMNVSRLYEQYFNGMSRHTKRLVTGAIDSIVDPTLGNVDKVNALTDVDVANIFKIPLGLLEIIGTAQYDGYLSLLENSNIQAMRDILLEIIDIEMFIYYTISSEKKAYQIVEELKGTIYEVPMSKVIFNKEGKVSRSYNDCLIAPLYIILLFKTGDEYLSVASAKTNHYNFPISASKHAKTDLPYRSNPVKVASETESRIYTIYGSRLAMAEMKDRANALGTHEEVYRNILNAEKPSNIDEVVDRNKVPFGNDSSIQLINSVFNCAGIELEYIPENNK